MHPALYFFSEPTAMSGRVDKWTSGRVCSHNAVWAATAHRQADGREYHPLSWLAGMRVCGQVGKQAYSKISYSAGYEWEEILCLPCQAALEDGRAGGVSMSLDFFGTFLVKQKSAEKNHLGSYNAITNNNGKVVQRNHFDVWGNPLPVYASNDPLQTMPLNFTLTNRGFTGHEHYPYLKIINMNGRLYDPVIGRFFSPDKYVVNSTFTQDFNRYTYARNNPLKYTDPSGEYLWVIPVVIGATWCAIQGGIIGQQKGATGWSMVGYIAGGAAIGAFAGIASYGVGVGVATAGFGAVTGTVSGALSGLVGGTISSAGMGALAGKSPREMFYSTVYGGLIGMGMGALMGGISDISNALKIRAVFYNGCKASGVNPKEAIPKAYRNSRFVKYVKDMWYKYAPDPSEGYIVENGGINLSDKEGKEYAGAVMPTQSGNKFTGGSTMYLHEQLAFTSPKQLFRTLGHELVHVSQFIELAGESFDLYNKLFREMLECGASMYTNFLGGNAPISFQGSWPLIDPTHYNLADYNTFWWTRYHRFWQ